MVYSTVSRINNSKINLETLQRIGSISAAFSSPVYVPAREESSGEERGLLSRTAAGNRAYTTDNGLLGRLNIGDDKCCTSIPVNNFILFSTLVCETMNG